MHARADAALYEADKEYKMSEILTAYLVTFGWAIVGSVSMGIGIIVTLKLFDLSTRKVDEWELIKQGNIPMAIILSSVIIARGNRRLCCDSSLRKE